jgi:hypothetical protein
MKTRRNHRKTTIGRRKRHVKHRVQTRINHRKRTVSSGRRHKFFKRGGRTPFDTATSSLYGTYDNGLYIQSHRQNIADQEQKNIEAALLAEQNAKNAAAEINYRAIADFVEKIAPKNTSSIIGEYGNIALTVKKLEKTDVFISNVEEDKTPVTIKINDVTVTFYINYDGNTVVIYVDDMLYGYVMIKIGGNEFTSDNRGIYNRSVSNRIIQDLNAASAT